VHLRHFLRFILPRHIGGHATNRRGTGDETDGSSWRPQALALLTLLAHNGLRIGEALAADVTDLGTERGHRILRITRKGGRRATVVLAPVMARALHPAG
jgi:integrase